MPVAWKIVINIASIRNIRVTYLEIMLSAPPLSALVLSDEEWMW
jgi:hypothetical protein